MYLIGAGGHGKVIQEILKSNGVSLKAFIDDNREMKSLRGIPVLHSDDGLSPVIVSVGANNVRKRIVQRLCCEFATAIHPSAVVSPSAVIGEGTVVMAGAIINADAVIGKHCIVNTGASVDHECVIGDYCHIAPHATLCGQVHVGEGALIGVGASVIPCVQVGAWSVVGAGAAVVSDVPDGTTVVGVPAKELRKG